MKLDDKTIEEIERNTAYEGNNWPNETVKRLVAEVKKLRVDLEKQTAAANEAVMTAALAEWMISALHKEPVSDFGESFSVVREVMDLHHHIDVLEDENKHLKRSLKLALDKNK